MSEPTTTSAARLWIAWILVAIPLLYGIVRVVDRTIPLFTGG
ncbi:MAG: MFS transporter small subunit [Geodermatophilaceae bacterium]